MARIATLQEIESHWSILDLIDANEALDVKQELEQLQAEQSQKGKK